MKHTHTGKARGKMFLPILSSKTVQAAMMTLRPGQVSGEFQNEHPKAEQWLFVISGSGTAKFSRRSVAIKKGSLLLIEKTEKHQIINSSKGLLVTLNFYVPPAYTKSGDVRPAVER